jgi:predicted nucleic acid-binding protein
MQRVIVESRKNLSLTDCLSFEIMEAQEIRKAFSFDKHFEERGFTLTAYSSLKDQTGEGDR